MKKVLSTILALVIILSTFTACGTEVDEVENTTITKYTTKGKRNELVPDATATGTLVVSDYVSEYKIPKYDLMEQMYNELYPNVKLTMDLTLMDEIDQNAYADKLSAQVMSGQGLDVLVLNGDYQDPFKMIKSGAFADLTPYFENDMTFDISKYHESIFYEGQYKGKQYLISTDYYANMFYGLSDELNATGFDADKCTDYYNTISEVLRVSKECGLKAQNVRNLNLFMPEVYGGLNIFDYENNIININNNDLLKKNYEVTKELCDFYENQDLTKSNNGLTHDVLILDTIGFLGQKFGLTGDKEVIIIPIKNATNGISVKSGGLYAVCSTSDNIQNAYNFLKLMLHPDFVNEAAKSTPMYNIPLSYEAIENQFDKMFEKSNEHTEKLEQDFLNILKQANEVTMFSTTDDMLTHKTMSKYFNNEATLDDCLDEAQDKLELYISE